MQSEVLNKILFNIEKTLSQEGINKGEATLNTLTSDVLKYNEGQLVKPNAGILKDELHSVLGEKISVINEKNSQIQMKKNEKRNRINQLKNEIPSKNVF